MNFTEKQEKIFNSIPTPKKPNIISNNTIEAFKFDNVSDGDYYRLAITYDLSDESFLKAIYFDIEKSNDKEIIFESTEIDKSKPFLYRVGNTIEKIFDEPIDEFTKFHKTTWSQHYEK